VGIDGIPGEVWKYGGEELEEWVWRFCERIWNGEGWPEKWKEGMIVPIVKRKEGERVEDYRGVPTLYKDIVQSICIRAGGEVKGGSGGEGNSASQSDRVQEGDGNDRQHLRVELFNE
jgi:hypothetical protein